MYTELQKDLYNDLKYLCGLIEFIARETSSKRSDVMDMIGKKFLYHIFENAGAYHCLTLDRVFIEITDEVKILTGNYQFDSGMVDGKLVKSVFVAGSTVPRMVLELGITDYDKAFDKMWEIYHSWMEDGLFDFGSDEYWQSPQYHVACLEDGRFIEWV